MKKIILITGFMTCVVMGTAQPAPVERPKRSFHYSEESEHYMKKSRKQNTIAWCMLGGGLAMGIGGYYMIVAGIFDDSWESYANKYAIGSTMCYLGTGFMIASIPVFIASARNKGRAMGATAGIKMEPINTPIQNGLARKTYPALTFKLTLK